MKVDSLWWCLRAPTGWSRFKGVAHRLPPTEQNIGAPKKSAQLEGR